MPGPTPNSDVNKLLLAMLARVQAALPKKVAAFYLIGSLSLGDFDPVSSDVDFLIVTTGELSEKELALLKEMHAGIAASGLPYATRLEGSYIPLAALRRYDPDNASHPTIGTDWDFVVAPHGSNWIIERYIVREHGVTVYGPLPSTLIDPVLPDDLRDAVCKTLAGFWQRQVTGPDEPEWLRPRKEQAFAVLTMCRALNTIYEGTVVSKPEAAAWALSALDAAWQPLIEKALAWRSQHAIDDLAETLSFIRYAISRGLELCDG
jgi:aminoglycoside adenylyltransferase-like protein/nucleotidyltransferase-like protein